MLLFVFWRTWRLGDEVVPVEAGCAEHHPVFCTESDGAALIQSRGELRPAELEHWRGPHSSSPREIGQLAALQRMSASATS